MTRLLRLEMHEGGLGLRQLMEGNVNGQRISNAAQRGVSLCAFFVWCSPQLSPQYWQATGPKHRSPRLGFLR